MPKAKAKKTYERELWEDVTTRKGAKDTFLRHMISKAAADLHHLDQIDEQLEKADFVTIAKGSREQSKTEINPLLAHRDKVSRTITADLAALGLTYEANPDRVNDTGAKGKEGENATINDYFDTVRG